MGKKMSYAGEDAGHMKRALIVGIRHGTEGQSGIRIRGSWGTPDLWRRNRLIFLGLLRPLPGSTRDRAAGLISPLFVRERLSVPEAIQRYTFVDCLEGGSLLLEKGGVPSDPLRCGGKRVSWRTEGQKGGGDLERSNWSEGSSKVVPRGTDRELEWAINDSVNYQACGEEKKLKKKSRRGGDVWWARRGNGFRKVGSYQGNGSSLMILAQVLAGALRETGGGRLGSSGEMLLQQRPRAIWVRSPRGARFHKKKSARPRHRVGSA